MPRPPLPSAAAVLVALAVAGCGGDDGETSSPPEGPDGYVVAALGDSITAGSPLWDPDPAIRERIGPALDERSQFEYWAARSDGSIEFRNCGVFGERTDQIAMRLDDCAAAADALIVQGGINDIAQGRPVADAATELRAMVRAGLDLGIPVAVADVLPWNNGHPFADRPIADLNREIERIGREEDVPVLPFHDTLEDPRSPGTMSPGYTDDGDHPSIEGYRRIADRALDGFP